VHLLLLFGYVATCISGNTGCVAIVTIATPTVLLVLWPATLHGVARTLHCVATEENLLQHQNKVLCKPIATASVATPPNQIFVLQFCLLQHFLVYCNTFRPLHQGENLVVSTQGLGYTHSLDDHTTSNFNEWSHNIQFQGMITQHLNSINNARTRHNNILHGRPHSNHADQTKEDHPATVSSPNSPLPLQPPSSRCTSAWWGVKPSLPI
jgi:hypothetical protein